MVLINFKDRQSASLFYEEFNGKSYNAMDVSFLDIVLTLVTYQINF